MFLATASVADDSDVVVGYHLVMKKLPVLIFCLCVFVINFITCVMSDDDNGVVDVDATSYDPKTSTGALVSADTVVGSDLVLTAVVPAPGNYYVRLSTAFTIDGGSGSDGLTIQNTRTGSYTAFNWQVSAIAAASAASYAAPSSATDLVFAQTDNVVVIEAYVVATTAGTITFTFHQTGTPTEVLVTSGSGVSISGI